MDIVSGALVIAGLKYVGPQAADVLKNFMTRALGPTADAVGDVIAHPIVEWQRKRVERAAAVVSQASELLSIRGTVIEPVPGRILMPLLEKASLEEDDALSALWANLLAAAAGPQSNVLPAFVGILGELSPIEARLLEYVYAIDLRIDFIRHGIETSSVDQWGQQAHIEQIRRRGAVDQIRSVVGISDDMTFAVIMGNLERIGLVRYAPDFGKSLEHEGTDWGVAVTPFGRGFLWAIYGADHMERLASTIKDSRFPERYDG